MIASGLSACDSADAPEPTAVVRPAKLITVSQAQQETAVRLPAIVGAADSSLLTFQVTGLLQELLVSEGETVERGQVLARLDQRDFRNSVTSAQAEFQNAQSEFERAEQLVERGTVARSVFDQRRSQRDVARAALDSARKRLDDTVIRAPFAGVIAEIYVEAFESVGAQQRVLTLQSAGDAEAIVQVPASLVINIQQLEPLETALTLDAAPGVRLPAIFVESASAADPTTQTFEARFAFTPPDDLVVLPGMTGLLFARFRTPAANGQADGVATVPLSAVLAEAGEPYVWLVDQETMTVTRRSVEVGQGVDESVVILSGLVDGDVIVGAGGAYLFEGAKIRAYEG